MSDLAASTSHRFAAGDDLLLKIVVTKNDEPVDMTGMTFMFAAALMDGSAAVISTEGEVPTATVIEDDDDNAIDVAEGSYGIEIDGAVTEGLSGTYKFVSKVIDAAGDVATVARGYITFVQDGIPAEAS